MVGERYRVRGWIGGAAALTLSLSALAACGERAPEENPVAVSMPDHAAGQDTTPGGAGADGTGPSASGAAAPASAPVPGTTTPSATGTTASGAVNPTDPAATTPVPGPETK